MTDDEWRALQENFDTRQLLAVIDDMDTLRAALSDDEIFDMLEAVTRLHETLEALTALQPDSLNDSDGEDGGNGEDDDDAWPRTRQDRGGVTQAADGHTR